MSLQNSSAPDNNNNNKQWFELFQKLQRYQDRRQHGDMLMVSPNNNNNDTAIAELGCWVKKQRQLHNEGTLRDDRKQMLNEIGFVWRAPLDFATDSSSASATATATAATAMQWFDKYEKLLQYVETHGSFNARACRTGKNKNTSTVTMDKSPLGLWLRTQRALQQQGTPLEEDHRELLNQIGFVWNKPPGYHHHGAAALGVVDDDKDSADNSCGPRDERLLEWKEGIHAAATDAGGNEEMLHSACTDTFSCESSSRPKRRCAQKRRGLHSSGNTDDDDEAARMDKKPKTEADVTRIVMAAHDDHVTYDPTTMSATVKMEEELEAAGCGVFVVQHDENAQQHEEEGRVSSAKAAQAAAASYPHDDHVDHDDDNKVQIDENCIVPV